MTMIFTFNLIYYLCSSYFKLVWNIHADHCRYGVELQDLVSASIECGLTMPSTGLYGMLTTLNMTKTHSTHTPHAASEPTHQPFN